MVRSTGSAKSASSGKGRTKIPLVNSVGIRELRGSLSQVMKRVQNGAAITVTDHGSPVALIFPADIPPGLAQMVADGRLTWRKRPIHPLPPLPPGPITGRSLSDAVLEEREEHERAIDAWFNPRKPDPAP